ncbi:MAG TPA: hypothetical protein PKA05_08510 [Roseiflexaceae bacterium]|nr:hypothetical protein [Roseiflexaceae bacterium]HMP40407.1 hypothetical protein [Roseiflexaceae bacterium]
MAEVHTYRVSMFGGTTGRHGVRAQIWLGDEHGDRIGTINFYDDGRALPPHEPAAVVAMHMPLSMLPATIDILRNERPVLIRSTADFATLTTLEEQVGEGPEPPRAPAPAS